MHVDHWFGEVTKYAMKSTSKMLIGNKIDAADHRVPSSEGQVCACSSCGFAVACGDAANPQHLDTLQRSLLARLLASALPYPLAFYRYPMF